MNQNLIWFKLLEGYISIKVENLIYAESQNQYTKIYCLDEVDKNKIIEIMTSIGIGIWARDLAAFNFCRIHNQYLVNQSHILKFAQNDSIVWLRSIEKPLPVSKSGEEKLVALIRKSIYVTTK